MGCGWSKLESTHISIHQLINKEQSHRWVKKGLRQAYQTEKLGRLYLENKTLFWGSSYLVKGNMKGMREENYKKRRVPQDHPHSFNFTKSSDTSIGNQGVL